MMATKRDRLGAMEELPENFRQFLTAVNSAYTDFDKDLEHTEHILKESSQELFKKNKELSANNKLIKIRISSFLLCSSMFVSFFKEMCYFKMQIFFLVFAIAAIIHTIK